MAADSISTVGWFLALVGGVTITFASHGRGLSQVPGDLTDLSMAAITGGDIKAVLGRRSAVVDPSAAGTASGFNGVVGETGGPITGPKGSTTQGSAIYGAALDLGGKAKGYQIGKTGPDYYDCSGLAWAAVKSLGYSGPRFTTVSIASAPGFTQVNSPQIGDMVVWDDGTQNGHMGIVAGNTSKFYSALSPASGIKVLPIATITKQKGFNPKYYRWTS